LISFFGFDLGVRSFLFFAFLFLLVLLVFRDVIEIHLVQMFEMLAYALHFLFFDFDELGCLLLRLLFLWILSTVGPKLVHHSASHTLVLLILQLAYDFPIIFWNFFSFLCYLIQLCKLFLNELTYILFEFLQNLAIGAHGIG